MANKEKLPKMLMVTWIDAHSEDAWHPEEEVSTKPSKCVTVGFLAGKTKHVLSIAGSADNSEKGKQIDYACVMTIPRSCILKVKKLS